MENPNTNMEPEINELIGNLPDIIRLKNEGNLAFKQMEYDNAIQSYNKTIELITNCEEKINENFSSLVDKNENLRQFKENLRKEIIPTYSNIALCYTKLEKPSESANFDIKVIALDPNFDKSYIRLIQNYIRLNKMDNAAYYLMKLKGTFNEDTLNKYSSVLPDLEKEIKQYSELMKKMNKTKNSFGSYSYIMAVAVAAAVVLGLAWFYYSKYYKVSEEQEF